MVSYDIIWYHILYHDAGEFIIFSSCVSSTSISHQGFLTMHWTAGLVHSSRCLDNQCSRLTCRVMKDLIHHQKHCDRRTDPEKCDACKQYTIICRYHAMDCKSFKCPVPFCGTIKDWIECGSFPDDMRYAWNKDVLDSFLGLRSYEAGSDGSDLPSQGPLSFVGWVWSLYHCGLCGGDGCSTLACGKMNDVLDHYSNCKVRRGEKTSARS